jgi:hypothetical protein
MNGAWSRLTNLVNVAEHCSALLRRVTAIGREMTSLSTGALRGVLGFFLGTGLGWIACHYVAFLYAPVFVPLFALSATALGVMSSRSASDRNLETAAARTAEAWRLRQLETAEMERQLQNARQAGASEVEQQLLSALVRLSTADPAELLDRYDLNPAPHREKLPIAARLLPKPRRAAPPALSPPPADPMVQRR